MLEHATARKQPHPRIGGGCIRSLAHADPPIADGQELDGRSGARPERVTCIRVERAREDEIECGEQAHDRDGDGCDDEEQEPVPDAEPGHPTL